MALRGSLVPSSNRHINVEMRSCLLAHEQVERPAACNPPTKWSVRKQRLNVFGLERNDICGIGRLCVYRLHFTPVLAAASVPICLCAASHRAVSSNPDNASAKCTGNANNKSKIV